MNTKYLGDSYDLVKRFFCRELAVLGYAVLVDPMFTGSWSDEERSRFFQLVGAKPLVTEGATRTSLFLDPDTGVRERPSSQHVSLTRLAKETEHFQLVFSFDQSFSRQEAPAVTMQRKLEAMTTLGCSAMYYDSHARFVFASRSEKAIAELREHLLSIGLPASRLVHSNT